MNKFILIFALFILSVPVLSIADDSEQVITLKDGSQIKGILTGIDNGVYTVKTPIIGDVHVAAGDVASITNGNVPVVAAAPAASATSSSGPAPNSMDQQIAASQQRIMSDPQSMAMVQQLTQDPEMMKALQDPALVQAVQSHDYQAIQNNPTVQKLINDPQMKALILRLAGQQQQQNTTPSQ